MITIKKRLHQLSAMRSAQLAKLIPGGVNSPFRSFQEVGGHTIFFSKASGSKLFDIDGNSYIDYQCAWGPAVLGHCHPQVIEACHKTLALGPVFGAPHELELELATALIDTVASLEQVRFVNSGTEAVMSTIRLARAYTGRDMIIMFDGCYHGHSDTVLAASRHASSAGIPETSAKGCLPVEFNNADALECCLEAYQGKVAAVLIEPIAGSMSVIPPEPGYLAAVRRLCTKYGALLIFDEVLTGFRVGAGGAQELYQVRPDLSCFGKALAGGMCIGAYGGSTEIMRNLFPVGKVYQAGTFSGNPVTMAGGVETIRLLSDPKIFAKLESNAARLFAGLTAAIDRLGLPVQLQRVGSIFGIAFAPNPIRNYADSLNINSKAYASFFHYLLDHGVYMPPSSVDAAFVSVAHTEEEIDFTIDVCQKAFERIVENV
jgi:glutamate-1-semialdehyde 2,1-aminomutase